MITNNKNHFIKRLCCPVCESTNFKYLYKLPYDDKKLKDYIDHFYNPQGGVEHDYLKNAVYSLIACLDCELVFQENIPNDNLMYKLYEEWIDSKIVFEEQENYPLWYHENYAKQIINLVSFFNKRPSNLQFLDFGMGWGKWCLMARAFGCKVYGLELSKTRIAYAKKNGLQVLSLGELLNHKFDYINTDQVFEHIPNPLDTLKSLLNSLKPNGIIKISVPNGNIINQKLEIMDWYAPKGSINSLNVVAPLEHINCFKTKNNYVFGKENRTS